MFCIKLPETFCSIYILLFCWFWLLPLSSIVHHFLHLNVKKNIVSFKNVIHPNSIFHFFKSFMILSQGHQYPMSGTSMQNQSRAWVNRTRMNQSFYCSHVETLSFSSAVNQSHEYSYPHINSLYSSVSKDRDSQWQLNLCIIIWRFGTHELIDILSSFPQELCTSSDDFIPRILLFICDYPAVADYIGISLITSCLRCH